MQYCIVIAADAAAAAAAVAVAFAVAVAVAVAVVVAATDHRRQCCAASQAAGANSRGSQQAPFPSGCLLDGAIECAAASHLPPGPNGL